MKKVLFVAIAGVFTLGLTSCKKDWTCECQYSGEVTTYTIKDKKKSEAKSVCTGAVSVGLVKVGGDNNCSLK